MARGERSAGCVRTMTFTLRQMGSLHQFLNRGVTCSDSHLAGTTLAAVWTIMCKGARVEAGSLGKEAMLSSGYQKMGLQPGGKRADGENSQVLDVF